MKIFLHITAICCLFFLAPISAQAGYLAGGEMEYKSLGSGKYLITARIYRDCRGPSIDSSNILFGVFAGTNGGNSCGSYPLTFKRTSIIELPNACSWSKQLCDPQNTSYTGQGIEMHTFQCTVDFNATPLSGFVNKSSCCEVTFYAGRNSGRSGAITTGSAGNGMYVTCMLNICNLKSMKVATNNSPVFSLPPIIFHCCNRVIRENINAHDSAEMDALTFKLVYGLHSLPNISINYAPPFAPVYPLTPLCIPPGKVDCTPNPTTNPPRGTFLDSITGQFVTTPTKCDEQGPVAVEITERRRDTNGVWRVIGKTRRDWNFIVQDDCGYNNPPDIAYNKTLSVCEGDTLFTDIKVTDNPFSPYQTDSDTPTLHWVNNLPGAYITCLNPGDREKTYRLYWPTKKGDGRETQYLSFLRASDNHCPQQLFSEGTISILVKKRIQLSALYTTDSCNRLNSELKTAEKIPGAYFKWQLYDSTKATILTQIGNYSNKTSFPIPYSGKVYINSTISTDWLCGKSNSDSAIILPNLWVTLSKDTGFCSTVKQQNLLTVSTVQNAAGTIRYQWSIGSFPLQNDTLNYLQKLLFLPASIKVIVSDGTGCKSEAWRYVSVSAGPKVNLGIDREFCPGDTTRWTLYNQSVLSGNKYSFLWSSGEISKEINAKPHAEYWLQVTDTTTGCASRDTINLLTMKSPGSFLGPDRRFCPGYDVLLKPNNLSNKSISKFVWQLLNSTQILSFDSFYNYKLNTGSCLVLTETYPKNTGGFCDFRDTLCMVQFAPLNLKTSDLTYCYSGLPVNLTGISTKFRTAGYNATFSSAKKNSIVRDSNQNAWLKTNSISNKNLFTADYKDKIIVSVPDTGGLNCISKDSFQITFRHRPEMALKTLVQPSNTETFAMDNFFAASLNRNRYFHDWKCISAPPGSNKDKLLYLFTSPNRNYQFMFSSPTDSGRMGRYLFELYLKDYITGCESKDTTFMDVSFFNSVPRMHTEAFKVWPNPVKRGDVLMLRTALPWSSLHILDYSGRTVIEFNNKNENQIPVDRSLIPGLYRLQFLQSGTSKASIPLLIVD